MEKKIKADPILLAICDRLKVKGLQIEDLERTIGATIREKIVKADP